MGTLLGVHPSLSLDVFILFLDELSYFTDPESDFHMTSLSSLRFPGVGGWKIWCTANESGNLNNWHQRGGDPGPHWIHGIFE